MHDELLESVTDRNLRLDLDIHRKKILDLYIETIEQIVRNLNTLIDKIPNNIYNIKEALISFAYSLDPLSQEKMLLMGSLAANEILPLDNISVMFTNQDINDSYQQGFEAGYTKCLQVREDASKEMEDRFQQLDVE